MLLSWLIVFAHCWPDKADFEAFKVMHIRLTSKGVEQKKKGFDVLECLANHFNLALLTQVTRLTTNAKKFFLAFAFEFSKHLVLLCGFDCLVEREVSFGSIECDAVQHTEPKKRRNQ
jgi:hypothetical protein